VSVSNLFTNLVERFNSIGAAVTVTHYTLSLGSQNASTGCYAETYSAGATINMVILTRTTQNLVQGTGLYVKLDALGVTDTAVCEGDKILDAASTYYRVVNVVVHSFANTNVYYEAQLSTVPFHEL
jgi:hypothetical protein